MEQMHNFIRQLGIIQAMKTVIFDMDGVIYRGKETLPGATECLESLRSSGIKVGFLTNNSSRTREQYAEILGGHGIKADPIEIMTSSDATVRYLAEKDIAGLRVFVVGESGLADTLTRAGFEVDISDEGAPCQLVIVGWDRYFTFAKIARAQLEVMVNSARLIATNADPTFPAAGGRILPGAGTMVAAIEVASGKKVKLIGKPETISLVFLLNELGYSPEDNTRDVWVVGDRLETDIACGNAFGSHTVLVTTGIATRDSATHATGNLHPEYIIDSLLELPGLI
jgi:phosphoglycolate/pyridoxal phosphate phosphatase family enzyme